MDQEPVRQGYRRRNVYIDKDFQTKFIVKFCALVAAGSVLTIMGLYLLSQQSTSVSFVQARVKVMTTADFILPIMIQTVLVVLGLVSLGAVIVTLLVSHKIAGPLFRFKQTFKELSSGNFSNQVRLRSGDQLTEVAVEFNHMIGIVRTQLVQAKTALALLRTEVEDMSAPDLDEARRKKLLDLWQKVREMEQAMEFFKT